jgi:hypothetical protein
MLRGELWGRPRLIWALDVVIVVGFGAVAILSDVPAVKLLLAAAVALRIVLAIVVTLLWRSRQRAARGES